MYTALHYFLEEVKVRPRDFKDLVDSLLQILRQVLNHRLPSHFDYHKIPAPWIQTKLLEILTLLGADDIETSQKMYESLGQMIRKSYDLGTNMGYALVYQCVTTIT